MSAYDWKLLEDLCSIHAVSGREDRAVKYLREFVEPLADGFFKRKYLKELAVCQKKVSWDNAWTS